jgi:multidrug efflux pump subunit AcrA (membrane-fusion protein)
MLLGIAAICSTCFSACGTKPAAHQSPPTRVVTIVASMGAIYPQETLAGVIAPTLNIGLQSTLSEPTDKIYVKEGAYVRRGQVLARLNTADLEAALKADLATAASNKATTTHTVYAGSLAIDQGLDTQLGAHAALLQAQANLERDRTDLARYHSLLRNGYIAQQQVDTQQITVRTDEEAVRAAKAALSSARSNVTANGTLTSQGLQSSAVAQSRATEQVALAQAEQERVEIAKAVITAPVNGSVVNRNLNPGEYPGTRQIFTIQQVDPIYAILKGSGTQIARITQDAPASLVVDDLQRRAFNGKVIAVLNQIAPGSTDFEVKVVLPNHDLALRPGMTVEGRITLPTRRGVRVPETAFTDDTHTAILTVDANSTVHAAQVSETWSDGKNAVVAGLQAGTRVVSDGQSGTTDGQHVAFR